MGLPLKNTCLSLKNFVKCRFFSCRVQHVPFLVVILTVEGNVNF